jgi:hypothetical protein
MSEKKEINYPQLANKYAYSAIEIFKSLITPSQILEKYRNVNFELEKLKDKFSIFSALKTKLEQPEEKVYISWDLLFDKDKDNEDDEEEDKYDDQDFSKYYGQIILNIRVSFDHNDKIYKSYMYDIKIEFLYKDIHSKNGIENILGSIFRKIYNSPFINEYCDCGKTNCDCKIKKLLNYEDICSICHEKISLIDLKLLKCKHQLHRECYKQYNKIDCPMCKTSNLYN